VPTLDWPEKILETWKNHVEDHGSVEEVELATVRYRKLSKEIMERRAQVGTPF
jgi:squamous cell carcinoma antigen recognized by T-cells 3